MTGHLGMELASPDSRERPCGGTSKKSMRDLIGTAVRHYQLLPASGG